MGLVGGELGYRLLKLISAAGEGACAGSSYAGRSKLDVLLGDRFWEDIQGRTVIDFGCGSGAESIEMARRGAAHVIGIDIRESLLAEARENASRAGVEARCTFVREARARADVVVSVDSFEHFEDPAAILRVMHGLLAPDGRVWASFGPTWYHPYGGHLFSVFPWAHLVFTEKALIRWRSDFKSDGATRFGEVAGGLNQMTIRRFERIVADSPFEFAYFRAVPIRVARRLANRFTREFLTAVVQCKLVPATAPPADGAPPRANA
jgi:SAM-dependent methyltransferase